MAKITHACGTRSRVIRAVAGILQNGSHVFMSSRPIGKVHALSWEFPGGKLEAGETAAEALIRELKEEIGIEVQVSNCVPFTFIEQSYEHGDVELHVLKVTSWTGEPCSLEGQEIHWQDITKPCSKDPLLITTQKILDKLAQSNAR
ncbi:MAG TPA: (deoxy)nucleoside triphosphate pyrophosphohydrolase [Aquella sp.]|nr:(deoxy)nucleoside triphosphate pyrophosphohydrolase [Aquella sp.]